jgi:small redox-active disulfide protein 2
VHRIEVLGFDCPACRKTFRLVGETARELGIEIDLEKVSDPARIAGYRVLSVPGVAVDGRLVHQGSAPNRNIIADWLTARP